MCDIRPRTFSACYYTRVVCRAWAVVRLSVCTLLSRFPIITSNRIATRCNIRFCARECVRGRTLLFDRQIASRARPCILLNCEVGESRSRKRNMKRLIISILKSTDFPGKYFLCRSSLSSSFVSPLLYITCTDQIFAESGNTFLFIINRVMNCSNSEIDSNCADLARKLLRET